MGYSWGAGRRSERVGRALEQTALLPQLPSSPLLEQQRMAVELAPMVELWQRLLRQHLPNAAGRCCACTKGGTGLPTTPWPCGIYRVADLARSSYDTGRSRAAS